MRRGEPSPEIADECIEIAFSENFSHELEAEERRFERWFPFETRCRKGGEWTVSVVDARLVAQMGMSLGLVLGRYDAAVGAGDRLFAHPDIESLDAADLLEASFWYGGAQLSVGQIDAGVASLNRILAAKGYGKTSRARRVLDAIAAYAQTMEPTMAIPEPVRELASAALKDLRNTVSLRKELAELATMGELFAWMDNCLKRIAGRSKTSGNEGLFRLDPEGGRTLSLITFGIDGNHAL